MSDAPISAGRALLRWFIFTLVFILAGGIAAGLTALGYEWVVQNEYAHELYAIIFTASGYIAYRLAERVVDVGRPG
jgi:hypothetical protein